MHQARVVLRLVYLAIKGQLVQRRPKRRIHRPNKLKKRSRKSLNQRRNERNDRTNLPWTTAPSLDSSPVGVLFSPGRSMGRAMAGCAIWEASSHLTFLPERNSLSQGYITVGNLPCPAVRRGRGFSFLRYNWLLSAFIRRVQRRSLNLLIPRSIKGFAAKNL